MRSQSTVAGQGDLQVGDLQKGDQFQKSRKKHTRKSVHDARQKLVNKSGPRPEFQYDLLLMFAKNELGASLTVPLLAVIIAGATYLWMPSTAILYWLACIFITKSVLLAMCRTFLQEPKSNTNLKAWRLRFTCAELLYGATWASLAFITINGSEPAADIIIFATLIIVISIRMMFATTVPPIIFAGTLPITFALVARFAMEDSAPYWIMAGMAAGAHAYFIYLTRGLNSTVISMLEYRAEKDALIAESEEAKALSDEARHRAEAANRAKSRFLATMSHELRTPLNAILGFSEVLKSEVFGPHSNPTYKEYAKDIHESGEHLLKLINDILDLSRIEAERYELQERPVPLKEIVDDSLRLLRLRAENKGLQIVEQYADGLPKLWSDEKAVRQITLNLLSNAIKFTPNGGKITITVGENEQNAQFVTIADTGPGIPQEEIPKVLSPFGQGSLAHETAEGGTGLGLPIVRRLMELHNGSLDITSELRRGTNVTVTFSPERSMRALPAIPVSKKTEDIIVQPKQTGKSGSPKQKLQAGQGQVSKNPSIRLDKQSLKPTDNGQAAAGETPPSQNLTLRRLSIETNDSKKKLQDRNEILQRLEHLAYGPDSAQISAAQSKANEDPDQHTADPQPTVSEATPTPAEPEQSVESQIIEQEQAQSDVESLQMPTEQDLLRLRKMASDLKEMDDPQPDPGDLARLKALQSGSN